MAHENLHLQVEVEIDGTQLSNVSNLVLDQKLDWHHTFELRSPLDAIEGERAISLNSSQNFVGKEIKIVLKSQTGSAQLNLFKGIVTSVNLSRHGGAAADLVIKGHSSSILLDDGPGCSTHLEKSIKQIVQTATAQYPVNMISVKNSPSPDPMLHYHAQYNESTYNFLARLANTHGQWFFYNGVEMIFGKPEGASPIELNFGHDLASFDLSMKVMPLLFEANGYEYVQQATLKKSSDRSIEGQNPLGEKAISQSKALFSKNATVHNRELAQDNNELDTLVGNRVAGRAGELVVMSGVSDSPKLTVGCKIKIQGAGTASLSSDRTDYGIYIVTAVQHNMDGLGSYRNNFKAIPADLKVPPYNSNVRIPTIDTQMATVMDNKDPDGMGRIKVHLQWQKDGDTTDWIRYAAAHAGKDRGFYMLPEVDDEVIVAFENGNVSMPFALSSMYHGKAHSGDRKEDDNNTKAIRTKSGNEIYFNDKGGEEAIHIYTKDKKNEVLITMKDDGLIQITSNKMIKVEAKEDIEVKAKNMKFSAQEKIEFSAKEFKVDAQQLIEMNSTKDFKQKGLDVTVEATKGYKMNANATAELKANATMEISGNAKTTVKATGQLELSAAAQASLKAGIVMIN